MKEGKVDRFKVDEDGFTSDGYRRLEPASRKSMYIGKAIALVICAVVLLLIYSYADDISGSFSDVIRNLMLILLVVAIVYTAIGPEIYYRRYRYRIDDDKVEVRKGIVYISHTLVPIERIHQVDVSVGPINRVFGLADVSITTAGGSVSIEFLQEDVAESIANRLNDNVVKLLRDRA